MALIALAFGVGLAVLSGGGGAPAPAVERPVLTGTSNDIPALQSAVQRSPRREDLRAALAAAYLQRVRETGDPSFYAKAEGVLRYPRTPEGRATAGELALARHDFRGALELGRAAGALGAPIRVDALVELGRYPEAERELQPMVDRKPNLAAYARDLVPARAERRPRGRRPGDAAGRRRRRARPRRTSPTSTRCWASWSAGAARCRRAPRLRARAGRWCRTSPRRRRASRGSRGRARGCDASSNGCRCPST